jgi:hypothetical protein
MVFRYDVGSSSWVFDSFQDNPVAAEAAASLIRAHGSASCYRCKYRAAH